MMATAAVTLVTDAPGRVLSIIAAAGLLLFATLSWRARPKLAISDGGLSIRGPLRAHRFDKADIKIVRITEFRRIGRKVRLLEIDTNDDQLFVLTRWDLGTDPLDVLDALTAAGLTGR
jgi:Bacterial PH domain